MATKMYAMPFGISDLEITAALWHLAHDKHQGLKLDHELLNGCKGGQGLLFPWTINGMN